MSLDGVDLRVQFGATVVLENVSVTLEPAECVVLIGASGSGKTTLLRTLAGLLRPDRGRVVCDQRDRWASQANDWVWPRVSMMFQSPQLVPHLTSAANCTLGLEQEDSAGIAARVNDLAESMGVVDCLSRKPRTLSMGQQQRVALLRLLVRRPTFGLLDEPTSALDPSLRVKLAGFLKAKVRECSMGLVVASHDWEFAARVADRFLALRAGELRTFASLESAIGFLAR